MRYAWLLLLLGLSACTPEQAAVAWVSPTSDAKVAGIVHLRVEALAEPPPTNVTFYLAGEPLGKVYNENGAYEIAWDSAGYPAGSVNLVAKPFDRPAVEQKVEVISSL